MRVMGCVIVLCIDMLLRSVRVAVAFFLSFFLVPAGVHLTNYVVSSQIPCQAADGTNNWGVFEDNYAYQQILWSQAGSELRVWDATGNETCLSVKPRLSGVFESPPPMCPSLNTQFNRDFYLSTTVPTVCNCTRNAFDVCVYQLQISDVRCGTPYKVWFSASPDFPVGERLGDGQQVSGPGRVAIDMDVRAGSTANDACSILANAADMSGHWCVVNRGSCSFEDKVRNCLGGTSNANNVLGVLLVDNVPRSPNGFPSSSPGTFSFPLPVPVIMIAYEEGQRLRGSLGSTLFTLSKTIGPAQFVPLVSPGVLRRESRTAAVYGQQVGSASSAYRFFWEPNRLLGWGFGVRAGDKTISNVAVYDLSNAQEQPRLLRMWTFAKLGIPHLNWSPSRLVFGQQSIGHNPNFFWIMSNGTSYVFWNVTGAPTDVSFVPMVSIPVKGDIFIDRNANTLWQQIPSPIDGNVQQWRYQEAWEICNITCPRLLGSFALDISFLTGESFTLAYPSFDSWGTSTVSFNLGDDGVGFYNYSDPIRPILSALRDTSPSSCAPTGVGGPSGAIVPVQSQRNVWVVCQQYEQVAFWQCGRGALPSATLPLCESSSYNARIDLYALQVLPNVRANTTCEDGAIVNMFWSAKQ
jgi:hypothetical protein